MYLPYARTFKRTKQLKKEKGWVTEGAKVIKIDTKLSTEKLSLKIKWVDFILPLIITLLSFLPYTKPEIDHELLPIWLKILISVFSMGLGLLIYPLVLKFPNKVYGDDSDLNIKINFKKKNLLLFIVLSATVVGAITDLCTSFAIFGWLDFTVYIILISFLCITLSILCILAVMKYQAVNRSLVSVKSDNVASFYEEDERFWKGGIVYYNKNDSRLCIESPFEMNLTFNFAKPAAKFLYAIVAVIIIWCFWLTISILIDDFTPNKLEIEHNQTIEISSHMYSYKIEIADVESIQLINTSDLPNSNKLNGTATDYILRGEFKFNGYGKVYAMINKEISRFIIIECAEGPAIFYNEDTEDGTERIYYELLKIIP